jgi:uncharacterized membrane protein
MAPLIVLVAVTLVARLAGRFGVAGLRSWQSAARLGMAVMLCFTAAAHFNSMRPDLVRMVPAGVPNAELMVTFTGVCELLGAVGLLVPGTRRAAAVALIAFFIAVLPANVHAAREALTIGGSAATPLLLRVPLQFLFIAVVWWTGWQRAAPVRATPAEV